MLRVLVLTLVSLSLTGCADRGRIVVAPEAATVGVVRSIHVATSRGPDAGEATPYGRARSAVTRFAVLDVSVPPDRAPGTVDWPKEGGKVDLRTQFVLTRQVSFAQAADFRGDLARSLAARPRGDREAAVFVHGFNTTFAEGAYRFAQLGHDLDLPGVQVHYSWPSRAQPLAYAYDRDSVLFARDGFEELLNLVADAGAERIVLVAHSMGSALTMETLRQMAIGGDRRVLDRISGVVLMSPDLDVDVFIAQARRIGELPQPFVVFTSRKDRALKLAARFSGEDTRLGNLQDPTLLADLKVMLVEVGNFSTGAGHFTPGTSPVLLKLLGQMQQVDAALALDRAGRIGLLSGVVLTAQNATQIILSPIAAVANATE